MSEYAESEFKIIKAIVICKISGEYLVDLIMDSDINPIMISSFVSALSMFGSENMGKIEEISVKGIDVEMVVVSKHDLTLIALMDKEFYNDIIRERGEKILDLFHEIYHVELSNDELTEVSKFRDFRDILMSELQAGINKMKELEEKRQILKSGFEYMEK